MYCTCEISYYLKAPAFAFCTSLSFQNLFVITATKQALKARKPITSLALFAKQKLNLNNLPCLSPSYKLKLSFRAQKFKQ